MTTPNLDPAVESAIQRLRDDVEELKKRRVDIPEGAGDCCVTCDEIWTGSGTNSALITDPPPFTASFAIEWVFPDVELGTAIVRATDDLSLEITQGGLYALTVDISITNTGSEDAQTINWVVRTNLNDLWSPGLWTGPDAAFAHQDSFAWTGQLWPTSRGSECETTNAGLIQVLVGFTGIDGTEISATAKANVYQITPFDPCLPFECIDPG